MSHNETRISNERLADLLTAETMLVVTVGEFRSILTEIQALRSTLVDTDHLDAAIRLTKQIEGVFYHDHPGGALQVRAKVQLILAGALAHPLPNPSPSDGEVSDVLRRARNYIDDMPHLFPENAHPNDRDTHRQLEAEREPLLLALTAAIQSKRGQP